MNNNNVIYVTGMILAKSGHHVAKNWICFANDSYKDNAIQVIDGDLVMTNAYKTTPYCIYAAKGGITCTYGNIEWLGNEDLVLQRYIDEIEKIKKLANLSLSGDLVEEHLKCLNAGVFAAFESFHIELLSTLILSDKSKYEGYIIRKSNNLDRDNLMESVYQSIHYILGHKMPKLVTEFKEIGVILPDTKVINEEINFRHDVIHRSGKKIMGNHLEKLSFTKDGLDELIEKCNTFVMSVMDEIK